MLLAQVVETSTLVSRTPRRLEKIDLLAGLLRQLDPDEVQIVVAFLSGYVGQGRIGIGYATLSSATASPSETATLEIREVDRLLGQLAAVKGAGSERERRDLLHSLLARATVAEQRFLAGLLVGEIRQGALEGIMIDALAKASGIPAAHVRRAVMLAGDIARVAHSALESGAAGLAPYDIQLFRPVLPMLAQPAEDVDAALSQLGETALEYKFDGARVQVHRSNDEVRVYSRALNDVTDAVPEIVEVVRKLPAADLILDGEVIGLAPDGRPQPFQVTARRFGRKLDLDRIRGEVPLTPFWFDLLYLEGQPLLDEPQSRRFSALAGLVPPAAVVPHLLTADPQRARNFLHQALQQGHEGIMAKEASAPYAAGARGQSWLKIKKTHTLDQMAQQSSPRRARRREGRVRHAWQDLQGPHGRNAGLADRAVLESRSWPR